ncbi:hypothetical protein SULPSESMR1_02968 [Pseudosulfitobacter pseudonitzschiae]|jgi:hypothetical protein|uniref:Uncharacterized protein n=1 Tax=Pseudosulfitobacter pseudonitzschiae TaxID=1402135 RepID=A0A221K429_9RHOB|nr:hypothetical protein SULPSESMR1_02968 [Pseudosulfitobacter pseudonitzschiae]
MWCGKAASIVEHIVSLRCTLLANMGAKEGNTLHTLIGFPDVGM